MFELGYRRNITCILELWYQENHAANIRYFNYKQSFTQFCNLYFVKLLVLHEVTPHHYELNKYF